MDEVLSHPASRAQQRLWFVEQLVPGEPVHNISFEGRFDGRLDEAVLRAAVADVVARHESLRTRLESRGNELWQVVLTPPDEPPLTFVDLADQPPTEYQELCDRLGKEVFDLGVAPLLRMAHVRLAEVDALVIVVHHAVADAVSADILVGDLIVAYNARLDGNPPAWPELPVQYADFTAWQEEQASGPAALQDLAYWREQLADVSTMDLTHGRPRPTRLSQRGKRIDVALGPETAAALDAFVRSEHATAFMGVLAAYAAALNRVFGADDVAVSSTVAGRPLPEVQAVVGMFVDRVVLRLDLSSGPTFRELVRTARRVVAKAHDHSSVTFDQIVAAVGAEREVGVTPLAQAAINLQPPAAGRTGRGGRMPRMTTGSLIDTGVVGHDLSIDLVSDDGYTGTVRYRSDIVSDDAAQRVATLFTRFVREGLADPDRPLWTIDTEEVPAVQPAPAGGPELLHAMIAQWAARTPDAPALVWPGGRLSFAEYVAAANRLAHELRAHGVGPEVPVVVAADRSPELFVGMLAVLTAGGIYVPVDPAAPAAHLATIVEQTGATLALGTFPGSLTVLPLSAEVGEDPGAPDVVVQPSNAAYVLFTSGSTGVPKGVVVEHRNVVAYLRSLHTLVPGPSSHLTLQPPTFDSSMTSSLGALAGGGALHIVDDDTARDPAALAAFLAAHPVDYYKITPSHLSALGAGDELRPRNAVILGGEAAGEALTGRLLDAGWGVIVHYGPTETTIGVCAARLDDAVGSALGRPLPGTAVYVLDRWGKPVPPGCRGEVYVGGPQVTRGYLSGFDGRYLPDPFHGGRMYRTGDLARRLPDGMLVFCGRADRQVKVRGFRVEPGSVEAALESHPSVRSSAVVLRDGRLVAYVTPAEVSPSTVAEFATTLLPAHAVPAEIVPLAELPMTRHGKLDVVALPSPAVSATDERPATALEAELLACWQAAMPGRDFGVTDGFFDVGGDSIRAIHVVAEARRRNLSLTLRQLFGLRTIRALAAVVSVVRSAPLGLTSPTVLRVPVDATVSSHPGVTVDGSTVTVDPTLVPDELVADLISASGAVSDAPGVEIPASTVDALALAAHEAYATTTFDLIVAAAVRALGAVAVPSGVVRVPPGSDGDLIRSVKAALRSPAEDDPELPAVRYLAVPPSVAVTDPGSADRVVVMVAGARVLGPEEVAVRVRDHLVELVEHCLAADTTYSAADFPDSGLDDDAMARLLSGLDTDSGVAP